VFDWNQIEQAKLLGTAKVNLEDLESFQGTERICRLTSPKLGEKGEIRLQMTFQPEMVAKARKATSIIGSAGRAMTQVGTLPFGAGLSLVQGVENAGKAAKGAIFKKDYVQKPSVEGYNTAPAAPVPQHPDVPPVPAAPARVAAGQVSQPIAAETAFPTVPTMSAENGSIPEAGTLRVTVLHAKDLTQAHDDVKPYVILKLGEKEQKTKHLKGSVVDW
jgi:Ca2+-dependent lipid-binding protein